MGGESAAKIWGAFDGIFGSNRLNSRWEAGAKSEKIMAMVGDSGAEEPCLMGDVPPAFLLNCVCDFSCVKPYSPPAPSNRTSTRLNASSISMASGIARGRGLPSAPKPNSH